METVRQLPEIAGYELEREISAGWASTVQLVRQVDSGDYLAIKLINIRALDNPGIANALKRESGMVAGLSHDNVIRIHETGVAGDHFYLVMDYLAGGELGDKMVAGMGWRDALSVARSIADALAHAHDHGIVHRDIRPSNVLFDGEGRPVLSNFAISRILERDSEATRPIGSAPAPHYASPELIQGRGATPRSDVYSLGVMLYEMLAGSRPFAGETAREVRAAHLESEPPAMPPGCAAVEPLVRQMLDKDPEERPGAQEAADRIEAILEQEGGATVPRGSTRIQPQDSGGSPTVIQTRKTTVVQPGGETERQPGFGDTWAQEGRPGSGQTIGVGSLVRDRFQIEGVLGEGGMGSVYYALDLLKQEAGDENPYVAMKVMHPEIASAELTFMALQREAKRAQDLAHPNIVTVFDLDRVDGIVYMTMELLRGQDSEQYILDRQEELDPETARSIVNDVSAGLSYAHSRGITHADLKPQNVFLAEDGRAKLLDFGIARAHRANKPDAIEEIFSGYTPAYASPEILGGEKALPSDDVYALGCIAYFYFTGHHPFDRLPATEARDRGLKPKRPRHMRRAEWRAVSRALSFEREKRPRDAGEFARNFSPSRVKQTVAAISTVAAVVALAVGLMLGERQGPEVPFDELPPEQQARINANLEDASVYASSGDINSALQLYDSVLNMHPGNRRATEGMSEAVNQVLEGLKQRVNEGNLEEADARKAMTTLLTYKTLPESARQQVRETRGQL